VSVPAVERGPVTAALASFGSGLRLGDVPARAVEQAKRSVLDTIGCALHGSTLPWGRMLQQVAAGEGGAPLAAVWGTQSRTSATQAALVNGTAGHSFELDDLHMGGMIHPGSLTLSAALALGESRAIDGETLLAAVVAGTETGARVGLGIGTGHFHAGFHPQGTVGVFAAAAAAARAARLDPGRFHHALGIAGTQAAGLMAAQEGAMVKRVHSGRAAQSGVLAALLAEQGLTGIVDVLEAEFGGFFAALGREDADLARVTDELGTRWETEQVGFKAYASCSAAHSTLDVVGALRARHGLDPDEVRAVTVHASTQTVVHCGWEYQPAGVTAAQMSIPYGVARMLLDGAVSAGQFTDEAIGAPRALELAARVAVVPDAAVDALGPARRYTVRVELETADGRLLEGAADDRLGSPAQPLTQEQLEQKFHGLATPVVGARAAADVVATVAALERLDDVRTLTALLTGGGR
jgi:2-methylcitrate dehydratase PrpD